MVKPPPDARLSLWALMANHLRHLRIYQNLRQHDVAKILDCSISQVSKYETGEKQLDENQCKALDAAWHTGHLFEILHYFATSGTNPNWSERLNHIQRTAIETRVFSYNIIPLPFQTEGYARSLLEAGHAAGLIGDVEGAVARRMAHQAEMLKGQPQIWAVLDEVALRPMGDGEVMGAQIDHLLKMAEPPHTSVRVLPECIAPHIGIDGSFWHFRMPNGHGLGFAGTALDVGKVIDDQTQADRTRIRFDRLAARARSEDESRDWLIRRRRKEEQ
ncbi:helix-turn-helix domain-containing protein [Actinomadura gamaensis]|uniref:Helix-turn-helix transcriptional regulator n=1 Tax=Actinomadura gamaensis TaxID=1763541 RepID=A0ABV9TXZ8_9ACTN